MRCLLDTHAFLWWLAGDRRLSTRAKREIGAETNTCYVSAASAWEISTKYRLGKLPGAAIVADELAEVIASQTFEELPISVRHAQRAGGLPGPHRDPFDRMLIAQAQLEGMTLVSNETLFDDFGVSRLW